jgi:hypothetical protein
MSDFKKTIKKVPIGHPEPGPEPFPETSNVILNLFQDQRLTILESSESLIL